MGRNLQHRAIRTASNTGFSIARDEEEVVLANKRVRNMNKAARSAAHKQDHQRPVWKPGDPLPPRSTPSAS